MAKRKFQQQNEQLPINTPSNKPNHKSSVSFNSNDKRKTALGEPNNNNNNNNNNYDYTHSDNASVDNNDVFPSEGDDVHCSRRTRKQPDRLSYRKMGGVAELLEHLANTCLYLFDKAKCMGKYAREQCEDLEYAFIERPKTILAAYYAKF